jgi:hypothetical protein
MPDILDETIARPTDLQSGYKRLLASAACGPVRIQQKGDAPDITMINRQVWRDAATSKAWIMRLSGVVNYAALRFLGRPNPVCPSELSWITSFDDQGMREFVGELSAAILRAAQGGAEWSTVDAVVKEWMNTARLHGDKDVVERVDRLRSGGPL